MPVERRADERTDDAMESGARSVWQAAVCWERDRAGACTAVVVCVGISSGSVVGNARSSALVYTKGGSWLVWLLAGTSVWVPAAGALTGVLEAVMGGVAYWVMDGEGVMILGRGLLGGAMGRRWT